MDHKVDLYLNGHEHDLEYAYYPYSQSPRMELEKFAISSTAADRVGFMDMKAGVEEFECEQGLDYVFPLEPQGQATYIEAGDRYMKFNKGDAIHQFTTATTGFDLYSICLGRPSMGRWGYAANKYHGFAQLHVDVDIATIVFKGVDEITKEVKVLYTVDIVNNKTEEAIEII
mmetsp:Transcript_1906/g.2691  ORF Transcript_1906/g.2691 Transcript_1906/m.2691 type:complete len:172 (-) Transcript_1906:21-536(-)